MSGSDDKLSHFNARGEAHMVDISGKSATHRHAVAAGVIAMQRQTLERILQGSHAKGDVLGIARIAGIMAAKRTASLIPLCHPLPITHIEITLSPKTDECSVECVCCAETMDRTGVEMEALTAVQISLLTIYDMCKAMDRGMVIGNVRLLEKEGGKSGLWRRAGE
ncbi:MAG: cyclic pyranopterin monophosphate synthase MoaC [Candidatus Eutrophobiaceae bacterium]